MAERLLGEEDEAAADALAEEEEAEEAAARAARDGLERLAFVLPLRLFVLLPLPFLLVRCGCAVCGATVFLVAC